MTLTIPDEVRAKAEIYLGDAAGQENLKLLLLETGLPSGILPLRDIIECGYVEETGFVWLKQRRKVDHYFAKAGRHVSYGAEVSAVADKGRLKKITGVKAKEMLIWVTLNEICVDDPPTGKLHCKVMGGFTRSFPVEAFEAEGGYGGVKSRYNGVHPREGKGKKKEKEEEEEGKGEEKKEELAGGGEEVPGKEDKKDGAANGGVEKVEEKLKEMSTAEQVVQGEAVAAKN